jgi:hypothetical protein
VQLAFFVGEISLLLPLIDLLCISSVYIPLLSGLSGLRRFPWYRNSFLCLDYTRFYNFRGEPQAHLEREQFVYGYPSGSGSNQKNRLITIFFYLLFSILDADKYSECVKLFLNRSLYIPSRRRQFFSHFEAIISREE